MKDRDIETLAQTLAIAATMASKGDFLRAGQWLEKGHHEVVKIPDGASRQRARQLRDACEAACANAQRLALSTKEHV